MLLTNLLLLLSLSGSNTLHHGLHDRVHLLAVLWCDLLRLLSHRWEDGLTRTVRRCRIRSVSTTVFGITEILGLEFLGVFVAKERVTVIACGAL